MSSVYSSGFQGPMDQMRGFFSGGSVLSRLILVNAGVFLLVSLVNLFLWLFQATDMQGIPMSRTLYWLGVPADIHQILQRPWTVVSYMFFHEGFFHLIFNMIVLYFGGQIFTEFLGSKRLLLTYLLGGLSGAVFYVMSFNVFPVFSDQVLNSIALGASASVLAILIAAATYVPEYTVRLFLLGNLKLKHIALILIVLDVFSIQRGNAGGHIAHLGGAFFGFFFIFLTRKGLWTDVLHIFSIGTIKNRPFKGVKKGQGQGGRPTSNRRPLSDEEYNRLKIEHQQRTDKILDKIAKGGYESLGRDEKEFLFRTKDH